MKTLLIRLAKAFVKAVFVFAVLLLAGVAVLLYLLDRGVPDAWVRQVTDRFSSDRFSLHIDRVTFSIRDGLHLIRPRMIFHAGEWNAEPFITADRADVAFAFDFRPDRIPTFNPARCASTIPWPSLTSKNLISSPLSR